MSDPHTAQELQPLIEKLSREELLRLARLALRLASKASDGRTYAVAPPTEGEFSSDEDGLAWDAEGWDEFSAPG